MTFAHSVHPGLYWFPVAEGIATNCLAYTIEIHSLVILEARNAQSGCLPGPLWGARGACFLALLPASGSPWVFRGLSLCSLFLLLLARSLLIRTLIIGFKVHCNTVWPHLRSRSGWAWILGRHCSTHYEVWKDFVCFSMRLISLKMIRPGFRPVLVPKYWGHRGV